MKTKGVIVIDLMGEGEEMEKREPEKKGHACRCAECHCGKEVPEGYEGEGRAVRYDESLILLPQAYTDLWGRWNSK